MPRLPGRFESWALTRALALGRSCYTLLSDGCFPIAYTQNMRSKKRTNREVEIKLPVKNLPDIIAGLRQIGAVSHGRAFEANTLYDTSGCDFRCRDRLLRVRIETGPNLRRTILTAKAPVPKNVNSRRKTAARHKEKLEREVTVRDPKQADRLMRAAGLSPTFRYEKYRTSFRLGRLHLDLDETPLGNFLELEGRPGEIDPVARRLGYSTHDYILGSYWDIYAADCPRRGRPIRNMVFSHKKSRKHALSS